MANRFLQQRAGLAARLKNFLHASEMGVDLDDNKLKFANPAKRVHEILAVYPSLEGDLASFGTYGTVAPHDARVNRSRIALNMTGAGGLDLAGDADNAAGLVIATPPEGILTILGAVLDAEVVVNDAFNASPNDVLYVSVGTSDATNAADGDLTGTEANIIPKTTLDTVGNTVLTHAVKAFLAAPLIVDFRSAQTLVFNVAVLNASTSKAVTVDVTGYLTLLWAFQANT